jgi:hypothetical protein
MVFSGAEKSPTPADTLALSFAMAFGYSRRYNGTAREGKLEVDGKTTSADDITRTGRNEALKGIQSFRRKADLVCKVSLYFIYPRRLAYEELLPHREVGKVPRTRCNADKHFVITMAAWLGFLSLVTCSLASDWRLLDNGRTMYSELSQGGYMDQPVSF